MHRGMRGKWDFIDMINGGVACLADEVQSRILQRRGQPPAPDARLFDSNQCKQSDQYKDNAQLHG